MVYKHETAFFLLFVDEGVSLRLFDPVGLLDVNFFPNKKF